MIARDGARFVHLGGLRGDRVSLFEPGDGLRHLCDLGTGDSEPVTPQRRLLLRGAHLFVLEPASGPVLDGPVRVRRLDLSGREVDRVEGEGAPGEGDLFLRSDPDGPRRRRILRLGVDPATGGALRHEETIAARRGGRAFSATPARVRGVWWCPIRAKGLLRVEDGRGELLPGVPGEVAVEGDVMVCAGNGGLWFDGRWEAHPDWGPVFPERRPPLGRSVAPWAGGLAILRPRGGALPVRGAGAAFLPEADYSDLVETPSGLHGVADAEHPRLHPVRTTYA